jgi:hypothetical protein
MYDAHPSFSLTQGSLSLDRAVPRLPPGAPPSRRRQRTLCSTAPSSPITLFALSLRGKHKNPTLLPLFCAQQHPHGLAGAAVPPPSGASRRDRLSFPLEPLDACASLPATCSTHTCTKWWPGAHSRAHAGEAPPRAATPSSFLVKPPP